LINLMACKRRYPDIGLKHLFGVIHETIQQHKINLSVKFRWDYTQLLKIGADVMSTFDTFIGGLKYSVMEQEIYYLWHLESLLVMRVSQD